MIPHKQFVPPDAQETNGKRKPSRFRASRTAAQGDSLAHLLSGAQNFGQIDPGEAGGPVEGPLMIIPSIRYPKGGDLIEGTAPPGPVELLGEDSDDGDERAQLAMRSRLERAEWRKDNPEAAAAAQTKRIDDRPESAPRIERKADAPKKVSRFKASRAA